MNTALQMDLLTQSQTLSQEIYDIVQLMSVNKDIDTKNMSPLFYKMNDHILENKKLTFILPAFPAKSANRKKTIQAAPDYAEVLALTDLNSLCEKINQLYNPGAEIVICSDGRVFNDLVFVSDENLMIYKEGIKEIIQSKELKNLKSFSLDDCYDHTDFEQMRADLVRDYAEDIQSIRERVKTDSGVLQMFNGIHRFMKEDLEALRPDLSKNQLMKQSKTLAYQVIQRSGAWDRILEKKFPNTLRLSIHPYPPRHKKFGVKLVQSSDRWATPWHNVALKVGNKFTLVKRAQALEMGATQTVAEGKYAFYQL